MIVLGLLLIFIMLIYVVHVALNEGGKDDVSQSVQKIMLNYLQVISLARSFPLRWPAALGTLFEIQGAVSTLGDHLVNIDCVSTNQSGAALFYSKQVMYLLVPPITGLVGFMFWFVFGLWEGLPFFAKRESENDKTHKDKFIVTVTTIVFLMFPTLCNQAFGLFSCKRYGLHVYLAADLEEQCYVGRHLVYILSVGIPQLLVYVIGLPASVLYFLRRNYVRVRATNESDRAGLFGNPVVVTRWGLFFKR